MKLDALCTYSQTIANVKYHYNILNNQSFLKITVPIGSPAKFMLKLIDVATQIRNLILRNARDNEDHTFA